MSNLSNKIINGIRTVAGKNNLPLHEPRFDEVEIKNLQKCIDSSYVSTVGKYVNILEEIRLQTRSELVKSLKNGNTIRAH